MNPGIEWLRIVAHIRDNPNDTVLVQFDRHNEFQRHVAALFLWRARHHRHVRCTARGADFIELSARGED